METFRRDLSYTVVMLRKNPGFAAAAILSLMLSIGASTTVFSFVNAILLREIPYEKPDRLALLVETLRKDGVERRGLSYPDYVDWRDQNQVFEQMAAYGAASFTLSGDEPERISGEIVSGNYFQVLGVSAISGRTFSEEEDRTPDMHPVAVIGNSLWRSRFNSDPNILGKVLRLNDRDYSVIGVMPDGFTGLADDSQIWVPMMMISAVRNARTLGQRNTRWHQAVARLKPGVTIERAQIDIDNIARRLEQSYPDTNRDRGGLVISLQEELFGTINKVLWVLMGAVAFVLLIACANLANLLLVRATSRQKEFALRVALGARRGRLIRQLLTESAVLALVGGALGLVLTAFSLNIIRAYIPLRLPSFVKVDIDYKAFAFTLLISVITGILCGLLPALRASRPNPNDVLKEAGRGNAGLGQALRNILVVVEITLTLTLVVGAGLMISSLRRLQAIDLGFKTENLLTMRFSLPANRYPNEAIASFASRLTESVKNLPSVRSVSVGSDSPLDEEYSAAGISIEGRVDAGQNDEVRIFRHRVTQGFFATAQIPILKGRDFMEQDAAGTPLVAIVSDTMARRYWPTDNPIGKRIKFGSLSEQGPWISVVGVAGDVKFRTLVEPSNVDPDVYFPLAQFPNRNLNLLVSAAVDPANLIGSIRRETMKIDPTVPIYDMMTLKQRYQKQTAQSSFNVLLLALFAVIALLLATIGVYGVMSYSTAQRTQEIGVRMALGAEASDILWMVFGQTLKLTAIGLALGLIIVISLSGLIKGVLYGVAATNQTILIVASITLVVTMLVASFIPARRAITINPVAALRQD